VGAAGRGPRQPCAVGVRGGGGVGAGSLVAGDAVDGAGRAPTGSNSPAHPPADQATGNKTTAPPAQYAQRVTRARTRAGGWRSWVAQAAAPTCWVPPPSPAPVHPLQRGGQCAGIVLVCDVCEAGGESLAGWLAGWLARGCALGCAHGGTGGKRRHVRQVSGPSLSPSIKHHHHPHAHQAPLPQAHTTPLPHTAAAAAP
jgi:hypothetical protein